MRVLLVTDALPKLPRGGLDLHVRELTSGLRRAGVDVQVLPMAGEQPDALGDLEQRRPGERLARSVDNREQLRRFEARLRELDPDAVHIHNLQGLSARIPAAARRRGARVLWTLHDFFPLCQRVHLHKDDLDPCDGPRGGLACGPCFGGGARGLFASPVFALRNAGFLDALNGCHHLLAPSRYLRDLFIENGVHPHRIELLAPAVAAPTRPAALPTDASTIRFVYAGDLRRAKGADLAVGALRQVRTAGLSLAVHGGSPAPPAPVEAGSLARMRQQCLDLDVQFHDRYDPDDLLSILDGAAALLVPSRVRESFGRTANFALLAGVPVIAADHGAVPELLVDGVNGLLFRAGDAGALARAMDRVAQEGLSMQARFARWPTPPRLLSVIERLSRLYAGHR